MRSDILENQSSLHRIVPESVIDRWSTIMKELHFAYQPLVNVFTGAIYGYECLLRNTRGAGYDSPQHLLDAAFADKILYNVDLSLRRKAISGFSEFANAVKTCLFYNLDNRTLSLPNYSPGNTIRLLEEYDLPPESICFEISERHELPFLQQTKELLNTYKNQNFKIALDDFGTGYSGLQLLYNAEPDIIKIDRFFIEGIAGDSRKKLFVSNIVSMAHILGIMVVGEGVETEVELTVCREIGCDLVQGYYISRPEKKPDTSLSSIIRNSVCMTRRRIRSSDKELFASHISLLPPVMTDEPLSEVFQLLKNNNKFNVLPVINKRNEPVGIIREKDLKSYLYTPYGYNILCKKTATRGLNDFVTRCPVSEINNSAENVLQLYSLNENAPGILISDNSEYIGFLDAACLLKILGEKNMAEARDQNPLTRLPGNTSISAHINNIMENCSGKRILTYFDLDNFKPFNDHYGFRRGDRAILLFSELLRKTLTPQGVFLGHIGGDDFFASISCAKENWETGLQTVKGILNKFSRDVTALYDNTDLQQGGIISVSRSGEIKRFPVLSVSAAVLCLKKGKYSATPDQIATMIAQLKKGAKKCSSHICAASIIPEK